MIVRQLDRVKEIRVELQILADSIQEVYDDHSEKWQESEKGRALLDEIDQLNAAADILSSLES